MNLEHSVAKSQNMTPSHRWAFEAAASVVCLGLAIAVVWTDNWALFPLIAIGLLACLTFMILAARHAPNRIRPWLYLVVGLAVVLMILLLVAVALIASSFSSG